MAHDHGVEDGLLLERELILAEHRHAHAGEELDVARGGLELAAEDLHERGLPAAVRPDQAVAVPLPELHGDVLEQGLGPELDGQIGGGDHGVWSSGRRRRARARTEPPILGDRGGTTRTCGPTSGRATLRGGPGDGRMRTLPRCGRSRASRRPVRVTRSSCRSPVRAARDGARPPSPPSPPSRSAAGPARPVSSTGRRRPRRRPGRGTGAGSRARATAPRRPATRKPRPTSPTRPS